MARRATLAEQTLAANGASAVFYPERPFSVLAHGTWGAGTLALQVSPDGGATWIGGAAAYQLTADGMFYAYLGQHLPCRLNLSGSTNPSLKVSAA